MIRLLEYSFIQEDGKKGVGTYRVALAENLLVFKRLKTVWTYSQNLKGLVEIKAHVQAVESKSRPKSNLRHTTQQLKGEFGRSGVPCPIRLWFCHFADKIVKNAIFRCAKLIETCPKRLVAVFAAKCSFAKLRGWIQIQFTLPIIFHKKKKGNKTINTLI